MNRSPAFACQLVTTRVVPWRVQDRDADSAIRVDCRNGEECTRDQCMLLWPR